MRSDLLLACIMGPLLAVFLLKGRARRLLAAIFGGMLIAYSRGCHQRLSGGAGAL